MPPRKKGPLVQRGLREAVGDCGVSNPSVKTCGFATSTPHSVACGDISPRRGESSLCTREALGGKSTVSP